ncbi:MAG: exodeoxyribonuclease VII large subunit [Phycisphaerae bacterium]|nr:exodeoxyribonuclease VII large subunit [Phycisphaerae bacterium]
MSVRKETRIYSVAEVTTLVKVALEEKLPGRLTVAGQIGDFRQVSSGHCYFTLKDEDSILPCVMWKSDFREVKFRPETGLAVIATGHIDVYLPGGRYQFYADRLQPAGVGSLQLAFEQLVKRLAAEGLFDEARKKPLPRYPMRIGIVTSPTGAAVVDIADSIYARWPCAKLFLYPVSVQGETAAGEIAAAIGQINRRNKRLQLEVLIVGRGGGSLEDLWAFNEEVVARAIAASKIPIISAVGHEVDTTIADFVADARASTPTKAGVIAVPDRSEVLESIDALGQRIRRNLQGRMELARHQVQAMASSAVLKTPRWAVSTAAQRIDEFVLRLGQAAKGRMSGLRESLRGRLDEIRRIEPHRLLGEKRLQLHRFQDAVRAAMTAVAGKKRLILTAVENRVSGLDPRAVLRRGYSITIGRDSGRVITSAEQVRIGEAIVTELADRQRIDSRVEGIQAGSDGRSEHGAEESKT